MAIEASERSDRTTDHHPLYLFMTGICMGSADVVPGVSGGTVAFIMGIYQQLLQAIRSVDLPLMGQLIRGKWGVVISEIPWRFIIPLGTGIVAAVLGLAGLLDYLLHHHEAMLFAFFFGLVTASIATLGWRHAWTPVAWVGCGCGAIFAFWLVGLVPMESSHSPLRLFGSGALAICAMILPGISGSFILLILGQYNHCVEAISQSVDALKSFDITALLNHMIYTVLPFGLGCAIGLAVFARVLGWTLARHGNVTIGALIGFMIGSLRRLWPFKNYLRFGVDRHGDRVPLEWENVWPIAGEHDWVLALGLCAIGFVLILVLDVIGHRRRETTDVVSSIPPS